MPSSGGVWPQVFGFTGRRPTEPMDFWWETTSSVEDELNVCNPLPPALAEALPLEVMGLAGRASGRYGGLDAGVMVEPWGGGWGVGGLGISAQEAGTPQLTLFAR